MKILAIDQSLNATGVCVLDDFRPIVMETILSKEKRGMERLQLCLNRISELVREHQPSIIVMEEYARQVRNSQALIPLVELGGCLKMQAHLQGYKFGSLGELASEKLMFFIQGIGTMKKFMLGNGSIKKDPKYLLIIHQKLGIAFEDDNQADAYMHACLAAFTHGILMKETKISDLQKHQQEALIEAKVKRTAGMSIGKALKMPEEEKYRFLLAA